VLVESRPDDWLVRFHSSDGRRQGEATAGRLALAVCRAALATLDAEAKDR
jgi:hypothetical protein